MSAAAFPANGALLSVASAVETWVERGAQTGRRVGGPLCLSCHSVSHRRTGWDEGRMALGLGFAA